MSLIGIGVVGLLELKAPCIVIHGHLCESLVHCLETDPHEADTLLSTQLLRRKSDAGGEGGELMVLEVGEGGVII